MPRNYNYNLNRVEDAVSDCKLKEPFVKCVAVYKTENQVFDATMTGFAIASIEQPTLTDDRLVITGTGSATVKDMKTSGIDRSLTIEVGYYANPNRRQPTNSVTLTDSNGDTFVWTRSNEENRS